MRRIFFILFVFFFFVSVFLYRGLHHEEEATQFSFPQGEVIWYGVYIKDVKVGYMGVLMRRKGEGYEIYEETYMRMAPMGEEREIRYWIKALTDKDLWMKEFEFELYSEGHRLRTRGKVEGNKLILNINGRKKEYELRHKIPATLEALLGTGRTGEFEFFDPTMQSLFTIEVKKLGEEEYKGIPATKYEVTLAGAKFYMWVDKNNVLLRQESPIICLEREPEEEAKKLSKEGLRLFKSFAIATGKHIPDPRSIHYLKVVLKNADLEGLSVEDTRQHLKGDTLIIQTVGPKPFKEIPDSIKKFTKPTPFIPSDDPRIKKKAEEIVGDKKGWEAVMELIDWVYENIKKTPTFSIPDAIDVLETGEGDCGEHAVLFCAFARSLGIPAKVDAGLAYVGGEFYYHAWNSVWLGRWVAVDPTFGQYIADASHIKLEEGDYSEQAKIMKVVGRLKIEVLEFK